jgi:transcriptional regulator with XRE-family HTH domain
MPQANVEPWCDDQTGTRIRRARLARGLTQRELAEGSITHGYLGKIERGGVNSPSLSVIELLATRLGLTADYLAWGNLPPKDYLEKAVWIIRTLGPATTIELRRVTGRNPPLHRHERPVWLLKEFLFTNRSTLRRIADDLEELRVAEVRS